MNRAILIVLFDGWPCRLCPPETSRPGVPGDYQAGTAARAEADLPAGGTAALYLTTWTMCREALPSLKKCFSKGLTMADCRWVLKSVGRIRRVVRCGRGQARLNAP